MISKKNIESYQGISLSRGDDFLYIPPNVLLQPYISCYTITFPTNMPDKYTILPSASSTMVISVSDQTIISTLRGVNTKICNVGEHANKMKFLLLIEFHSGCLFPLIRADQSEFVDLSFELSAIDRPLMEAIENELLKSESIEALVVSLDKIFLDRLTDCCERKTVTAIKKKILTHNGNIGVRELSTEFFYSEKHIRRLFLQHIGTSPKTFARIVRVNYALQLLQNTNMRFAEIAAHTGFFDQSHFIHDFTLICGLTPQQYMQGMSVFYNDNYKF
ncbi:helix-turn-helix transcriptional regulator [Kineothrix sp. MB12-C1]|uniref:helix-turn-helix transcriptional regulator n=1 Tax=Kineothrix sp. MB12-C1 TaxID=3070215 RepID=UPI0027D26EA7|nr:helix-turn-helix transcriptional regulator [Kineothrix sp. MB12-C1]WMC92531.1 helix-turn-helix transcriptional regulator [Kineothrix sp. MB12-C1]